ncbi:MAG: ATPase [Ruminococcaceae bacterium]|nr:ATPase [Oscillospiraceae bacterium]
MKNLIEKGSISLGIELGSTRIKAVLTDENGIVIETGGVDWENKLKDGVWIYNIDQIHTGLQSAYANLAQNVRDKYGVSIKKVKYMGISAMMHGYMAIDKDKKVLAPFRTWRNTITKDEAAFLSELFSFHIPQRWTISHLYQAVKNKETYLFDIDYLSTLSGYIHFLLTGEKVLGMCDASGMFPVDPQTGTYYKDMTEKFNSVLSENGYSFTIEDIFPKVLSAGKYAGILTDEGAKFLDPSGNLEAGTIMCPPEGDGGTGMITTNSIRPKTGNISAGTSSFAFIVLEKALSRAYEEVDILQSPNGNPSAMVQANTCTTEINCWVSLFNEVLKAFGKEVSTSELYKTLFEKANEGDADCGNLMAYCFHAGEHLVDIPNGTPLFIHKPDANFTLANFMRTQIYTSFALLNIGLDLLKNKENVKLDKINAHGGIFKTKGVAHDILSAAINTPVAVNNSAGEGGAWGIAILACYQAHSKEMSLEDYLDNIIFKNSETTISAPDPDIFYGYSAFMNNFKENLKAELALS